MGKGVGHRSGYLVGRIWGSMPPVYCTLPIAFLPRRVGSPTSRTLERVQHRRARAREAAPSARVVPTFAPGQPLVGQSPPKRVGFVETTKRSTHSLRKCAPKFRSLPLALLFENIIVDSGFSPPVPASVFAPSVPTSGFAPPACRK